jgi:hypothetical protein
MRGLLAPDILRMWEVGRYQPPIDRALTLLAGAFPGSSREELAALSINHRDAQLLELRRETFGDILNAFSECPQCAGHLEIRFPAAAIESANDGDRNDVLEIDSHGILVRFRLPTSLDLAEALTFADIELARETLLGRCVINALRGDDTPIAPNELPQEVVAEINRTMAASDPMAEVLLNLQCPLCAHNWQAVFDIAAFLWREISAHARRLSREVDALARRYGWSEAEILSLSATRRQTYLEFVEYE